MWSMADRRLDRRRLVALAIDDDHAPRAPQARASRAFLDEAERPEVRERPEESTDPRWSAKRTVNRFRLTGGTPSSSS